MGWGIYHSRNSSSSRRLWWWVLKEGSKHNSSREGRDLVGALEWMLRVSC
jgi:hypothetical protein